MDDDILANGRALAEKHGGAFTGKKNAYECDESRHGGPGCGAWIVTIDVHPGVTPFILKCEACGGMAHSKMYRVAPSLIPTHEWYRPDKLDGVDPIYFDHLSKGGLILRPIADGKWKLPTIHAKHRDDPAAQLEKMEAMRRELERLDREAKRIGNVDEMRKTLTRQQRRYAARKGRR